MLVSLYTGKVAQKLLFLQLMALVVLSAIFAFKSLEWGISALAGGLAAWLPNAMFMLFACWYQVKIIASGHVAWSFALGEGIKVIFTIALLIMALGLFKAAFIPLGVTYLLVLVVQILAPAVINSYRI